MTAGLGVEVRLEAGLRPSALLFGETTGRALVTFSPSSAGAVFSAAAESEVPLTVIGRVEGARLEIFVGEDRLVDEPVAELRELWTSAFARAIESAAEVL
jgi:phosphoribosylformylglycinamidine synthase